MMSNQEQQTRDPDKEGMKRTNMTRREVGGVRNELAGNAGRRRQTQADASRRKLAAEVKKEREFCSRAWA